MTSLSADDLNTPNPGLESTFVFPSTKRGLKIAYKGFSYVTEKTLKNGNVTYKCDYPNRECKGRLITNDTGKTDQLRC